MASEAMTRLQGLFDALIGAMHDRIVLERTGQEGLPLARAKEAEASTAYTHGLREVIG